MDDLYFMIDTNKLLNCQQYTAVKDLRDNVVLEFLPSGVKMPIQKITQKVKTFTEHPRLILKL